MLRLFAHVFHLDKEKYLQLDFLDQGMSSIDREEVAEGTLEI